ncbi:MAG: lactate utilization protein [Mailhella sp.]|nr:lactate utilization protein [Mailhella sp.]
MPTAENQASLVEVYKEKATATACQVAEFSSFEEAIPHLLSIMDKKAPCELLYEEDVEKGPNGPNGCPTRVQKIIAAPEIGEYYEPLKKAFEEKGYKVIDSNLRQYVAGIDMGVAFAKKGIAQSGTCMINAHNEDTRLATMVCEFCVLVLKKSQIMPTVLSMADEIRNEMSGNPTNYITFISGPSRTADIERVGAVGVHGPLEMHIVLLEG